MATKFKEYFDRMVQTNKEMFDDFSILHNDYSKDQDKLQQEFNTKGKKILEIVREWENKLCSQTEKAGYGNYSANLSEKFMQEVRKNFPLIDYIGVISQKERVKDSFLIKKIKL